uniref:Uncharacterized protein n=1 Tax=Tanacetum cinerariifolium TaxID=118510 RepID=A0A6L2J8T7_TANCI|nr:hypothetical protein [Tanacetum cinerariifolium]
MKFHPIGFGVDDVEDFKEYTLRDYYCWLKTYCCWDRYALLFNANCKPIRVILGLLKDPYGRVLGKRITANNTTNYQYIVYNHQVMAPATRSIAGTSNNEDGGVNERLRSLEEALSQVIRAMQEMGGSLGVNGSFPLMISLSIKRFGTVYDDPVSEIRKINYQTNAKDYQDAFDTLLSRVDISEEHAISFSLDGLPAEIEMGVRIFSPKTLAHAYSWTNYQEATLKAVKKKNKKTMTSCEIMVVPEEEEEFFKVEEGIEDLVMQNEIPQISLNALNGSNTFQTMRVTRKVRKHEIHILVDCSSTHNFLDANVAKKGCQLQKTCPLAIKVEGDG